MEAVTDFTTDITLTFNQLAKLALQLPKSDCLGLVSILQNDDEPGREQLLQEAIEEVNLAKQGR